MRTRFLLGLLIAATLSLCSCTTGGVMGFPMIGFSSSKSPSTPSVSMPALAQIATPDRAELALYASAKIYEAAVATINAMYREKAIPEDRYQALVAAPGSLANRYKTVGTATYHAIQLWRTTGQRANFDAAYADLGVNLVALTKGTGQ